MSDPKPQRAQNVIFSTSTEMHLFPWGWMHRAVLDGKHSELGIVFPGRVVRIKGDRLPDLIAAIHAGSVSQIAQKSLAAKTKGAWVVDSICVVDPDAEVAEESGE